MKKLATNISHCPVCEQQVEIDEQTAQNEWFMHKGFPMLKMKCPHCDQAILVDIHWEETSADWLLKLRPQHFYCENFLETWYDSAGLMNFLREVRRIIRCDMGYVVQVVPQGYEDDICKRCDHLVDGECQHPQRWEFAGADAAILRACTLHYGDTLTLEQIRNMANLTAPIKYCISCPFRLSRQCSTSAMRMQIVV